MLPPSCAKAVFDLSSVDSCCSVEKEFEVLEVFAELSVVAGLLPNEAFVGTVGLVPG